MKKFLIPICLLVFFTLQSHAEIRYVSKTGSSTYPYTSWETAADSIMKAMVISLPGDTIYVANGVYGEQVLFERGITLIGAGMDSCIIDTRSIPNVLRAVMMADSTIIKGFHVIVDSLVRYSGIIARNQPNRNPIAKFKIEHNMVSQALVGIKVNSSSIELESQIITNNLISNVDLGMLFTHAHARIHNNVILDFSSDGIFSDFYSKPEVMWNTFISEYASDGYWGADHAGGKICNNIFVLPNGWKGLELSRDTVRNNIIMGPNITEGISIWGNSELEWIVNNVIMDCGIGFRPYPNSTFPMVFYNNFWNNGIDAKNYSLDSSNIFEFPMFFNRDSLDFRLQEYSPLIDAGDPTLLDVDGSRSDIGLFGGPFGKKQSYLDLAPGIPRGITANLDSGRVTVTWRLNHETDFAYYNLYRDTVPNFTADSTTLLLAEMTDTSYTTDRLPRANGIYFKASSVDQQGNESQPSEEVGFILTGTDGEDPVTVTNYALYQNYPNPFNNSTIIPYRLKEGGYVKLYVLDTKGERIAVLVNEYKPAGYHEEVFDASQLASGIYIYTINVRGEGDLPVYMGMNKMILVK